MMELFNFCKMQNKLDKFIENLSVDKMNQFFEECQKVDDKTSIKLIIQQVAETEINFPVEILLYAIKNYEPSF